MFPKYIVAAAAITLIASPAFAQFQRPNYDTNSDGKVTVAEYVDASVASSMARLDTNKDGTISAAELAAMPQGRPGGGGGQRPGGGAGGPGGGGMGGPGGPGGGMGGGMGGMRGMAGADANSDGNITTAEMKASVEARAKTMDANNDGVLSTEEMSAGRGPRPGQ